MAALSAAPPSGQYAEVSLPNLVAKRRTGPMTVESSADLFSHPHMGVRVRITGRLKHDEPEGNHLSAVRRFYTLYRIENLGGGDRMSRVSLDLDRVRPDKRQIVEKFCGGAVACRVTVRGRIGEVAAERVVNLFSPKRDFTAMIGVIVERLDFNAGTP